MFLGIGDFLKGKKNEKKVTTTCKRFSLFYIVILLKKNGIQSLETIVKNDFAEAAGSQKTSVWLFISYKLKSPGDKWVPTKLSVFILCT